MLVFDDLTLDGVGSNTIFDDLNQEAGTSYLQVGNAVILLTANATQSLIGDYEQPLNVELVMSAGATQEYIAPATAVAYVQVANVQVVLFAGGSQEHIGVSGGTAPVIGTGPLPPMSVGASYSHQYAAVGMAPITWAINTGTLPAGLVLSSSGLLSGTPTTPGPHTWTVRATNSVGHADRVDTLTVLNPPIIKEEALPPMTLGVSYLYVYTATGATQILWSVDGGTLPPGLTLSLYGVLQGVPTTGGDFSWLVTASNDDGTDTRADTASVVSKPVISTTPLPPMAVGVPYSFQYTATSSGSTITTFTMTAGTLPAGITLDMTGLLSGTPTTAAQYAWTVTATNSAGSSSRNDSIVVASLGTSVEPVIVTPLTMYKDVAFTMTLMATGNAVISWVLDAGVLPPGLTLSSAGVISGKPTTIGAYNFRIRALNDEGADTHDFKADVIAKPVGPIGPIGDAPAITTRSAGRVTFAPKRPQTIEILTFDFISSIAEGEDILRATVDCQVFLGSDPLVGEMLLGEAIIVGNKVFQSIGGGVAGATYKVTCDIYTTNNHNLSLVSYLTVIAAIGDSGADATRIAAPKKQGERVTTSFDFSSKLTVGETLLTALHTAFVLSGVDSLPEDIIGSYPTIEGNSSFVTVRNGVVGVTYGLISQVTTSRGQSLEQMKYYTIIPDLA